MSAAPPQAAGGAGVWACAVAAAAYVRLRCKAPNPLSRCCCSGEAAKTVSRLALERIKKVSVGDGRAGSGSRVATPVPAPGGHPRGHGGALQPLRLLQMREDERLGAAQLAAAAEANAQLRAAVEAKAGELERAQAGLAEATAAAQAAQQELRAKVGHMQCVGRIQGARASARQRHARATLAARDVSLKAVARAPCPCTRARSHTWRASSQPPPPSASASRRGWQSCRPLRRPRPRLRLRARRT